MDRENVLLKVEDLSVSFDTDTGVVWAVDGLSLSLPRGRILGIVGETGCGKSVTARAILRVLPTGPWVHIKGRVYFEGQDLLGLDEKAMDDVRGSAISMVFQEPGAALNPTLKIGVQVGEVVAAHLGGSRSSVRKEAVALLGRVGIPNPDVKAHLYPHQLSGGMKQRAMIASAIACRPGLLIADEPTTALDVTIQSQILDLITALRRDTGMSVLLISHDLGIIAETCDEVAVMYLGRIVERGPVEDFFARPLHPYSKGLLEAIPRPHETRPWLPTIPGSLLNRGPVEGCNFAERCPRAGEVCFLKYPEWFHKGAQAALCFDPLV